MLKITKNALVFSILSVIALIIAVGLFHPAILLIGYLLYAVTVILSVISIVKELKEDKRALFWPVFSIILPLIVYVFGNMYIF